MSRALFLLYLIVEIAAFIVVSKWIGVGWALLALGGLFLLGIVAAAWEMRRLTRRAIDDPSASAGTLVVDSAMLVVGCLLLALPGFVSSILGLLLVLPPTKSLIRRVGGASLRAWFQHAGSKSMVVVQRYGVNYGDDSARVIDHDDVEGRPYNGPEPRA